MAAADRLGDPQLDPVETVFDLLPQLAAVDLDDVDVAALRTLSGSFKHWPARASALLSTLGWSRFPEAARHELHQIVQQLEAAAENHWTATALLVSPDIDGEKGVGLLVGLHVQGSEQGGVRTADVVDPAMEKQAKTVFQLDQFSGKCTGITWELELAVPYSGSSLGLSLYVAGLVEFGHLLPDPLLAATGCVTAGGAVNAVAGIEAKLASAHRAGFTRVLLPEENRSEVDAVRERHDNFDGMRLLFIDHVKQAPDRLRQPTGRHEFSFEGRVRLARASLQRYGFSLTKEQPIQHAHQFQVADAVGRATITVYSGRKGSVTATGSDGPTRANAKRFADEVFAGPSAVSREPVKVTIADQWRRDRLRKLLDESGAEQLEATGQAEEWRFALRRRASSAQVTLWTNGTCRVVGDAPAFDEFLALVRNVLSDLANVESVESREPARQQLSQVERPAGDSWIGTDESGKGDYFGPLVSAAVYVDPETCGLLAEIGVRDSKKMKDVPVRRAAARIREALRSRYAVTVINPPKYNSLHADFKKEGKSLNSLLAWGHTRSIKELLGKDLHADYIVVDKFADAGYIETRLKEERKAGLQVIQYSKAESDIAVAAASILARDGFLAWLERISKEYGVTLPKGASPKVIEVARGIFDRGGLNALGMVAKLSFKTTQQVTDP